MKNKPLIETNPYLKDPKLRELLIKHFCRTSSAVEGIKVSVDYSEEELEEELRLFRERDSTGSDQSNLPK